uniref:Class 2 transcription repressor NC2 beta 2 n=1 Tax=Glycine max TaxID=3847 RepID=A0A0R0JJZ0_SOYBN
MEPMDIVGKAKEDASLPKATMTKIIKEMLPPDVRVARDAQDLLIECCVEFINLVSSESNEVCNKEERRTIAPEHVLKALGVFLKLLNCCIAKVFMQIRSNLCLINYVISSLKCCFLFCILNFNFYLVSFYVSLLSICEVPVILEIFFFCVAL